MKHARDGYFLMEATIAVVVATACVVGTMQVLLTAAQHRRDSQRFFIARLEVSNVLEEITALPFASVEKEKLAAWKLSPETDAALPSAKLRVLLKETMNDGLQEKHVTAEVEWAGVGGNNNTVRLATWLFAPGEVRDTSLNTGRTL